MDSGPRGLFACWDVVVEEGDKEIDIRFPMKYAHGALDMDELASGGLSYSLKQARRALVRIPKKVDLKTVQVFENGREVSFSYDAASNRLVMDSEAGAEYKVAWDNPVWERHETLGPANDGHVQGVPVGSRITYKLRFVGNTLKDMTPCEGACLPYGSGL